MDWQPFAGRNSCPITTKVTRGAIDVPFEDGIPPSGPPFGYRVYENIMIVMKRNTKAKAKRRRREDREEVVRQLRDAQPDWKDDENEEIRRIEAQYDGFDLDWFELCDDWDIEGDEWEVDYQDDPFDDWDWYDDYSDPVQDDLYVITTNKERLTSIQRRQLMEIAASVSR